MKSSDLMLVGGAALAVFMFYKYMNKGSAQVAQPSAASTGNTWSSLMQTWQGWQYFSDGTVIGPDGAYYSGGVKVYQP